MMFLQICSTVLLLLQHNAQPQHRLFVFAALWPCSYVVKASYGFCDLLYGHYSTVSEWLEASPSPQRGGCKRRAGETAATTLRGT